MGQIIASVIIALLFIAITIMFIRKLRTLTSRWKYALWPATIVSFLFASLFSFGAFNLTTTYIDAGHLAKKLNETYFTNYTREDILKDPEKALRDARMQDPFGPFR